MGRRNQPDGDGLFEDRSTKFRNLRSAVKQIEGVSRGRRNDLIDLIELLEFKTLDDGRCHMTRQALADIIHWGITKFKAVYKLAEELGWIDVVRESPRAGGQGANHVRVAWDRIRVDARSDINREDFGCAKKRAPRRAQCAPRRAQCAPRRAQCAPTYNKEFIQTKDTEKQKPTNHGRGDGVFKKIYFGRSLEREDLRNTRFLVETVWPTIVRHGRAKDCDSVRHSLVAFACEAHRTFWDNPKIDDPMAVFVSKVSDGSFADRPIPECDDEKARRMLCGIRPRMQPERTAGYHDPDPGRVNEYESQVRKLAERKGLIPGGSNSRSLEAVAR